MIIGCGLGIGTTPQSSQLYIFMSCSQEKNIQTCTSANFLLQKGEPIRRKSLIDDARFDTYTNIGLQEIHRHAILSVNEREEPSDLDESGDIWTSVVSLSNGSTIYPVIKELEVRGHPSFFWVFVLKKQKLCARYLRKICTLHYVCFVEYAGPACEHQTHRDAWRGGDGRL